MQIKIQQKSILFIISFQPSFKHGYIRDFQINNGLLAPKKENQRSFKIFIDEAN